MNFAATETVSSKHFWETSNRVEYRRKADFFAQSLIDPKTGYVYKEISQERSCPICSQNKFDILFVKMGFTYVKCKSCEMVYTNTVLIESKCHDMYENSEHSNEYLAILTSENQRKYDENKFIHGLNLALERNSHIKNVLDIGCSVGVFLETAKKMKLSSSGIELNQKAFEIALEKGLDVDNKPLEDSRFSNNKFDLITLWDVLEHIINPKPFLKSIHSQLEKGGGLLILTPNVNSLASRILHEKCNMFEGWAHVSLFSVENLKKFLFESGFNVIHTQTIISEVNVLNNYLSYKHPYLGDSGSLNSILSLFDEKSIIEKDLGYKTLMYAEKRD